MGKIKQKSTRVNQNQKINTEDKVYLTHRQLMSIREQKNKKKNRNAIQEKLPEIKDSNLQMVRIQP